jgi:hypothetical protein
MPKKIDAELRARAVRLVNEHAGEYAVLLSGMSGRCVWRRDSPRCCCAGGPSMTVRGGR